MGKVRQLYDGLANALSGTGTPKDKAAHSFYGDQFLTDEDLHNAYRFAWLPRKIVDLPALDATRKWRNWQADTADIGKIESLEKKLGVQRKVREGLVKGRLFGGAAIYIGTGQKDLIKPLNENEQLRHLTVLTRRQLTAGEVENDPASEGYGLPKFYTIANTAQRIDPSRLILFKGAPLPDEELIMGTAQGWGDSVLQAPYKAVLDADGTAANIASLIFEAKIDVFKIPDLMERVGDPEYEKQLFERLSIASRGKSVNNALVMDANEDYQQKTANFSSLNDILMSVYQLACGAANMPATRVLGRSASGLNSSGDNEMRDYYDSVQVQQELEIEPAMAAFDELLIRNALGSRPADVWFEWASLWQVDSKEQAEIGSKNADTIKKLAETKLIPDDALSAASVTMMAESGVMPGLEQNVAESTQAAREEDDGDAEEAAIGGEPSVVQTSMGKVASSNVSDAYNKNQPRIPAGQPGGGRWIELSFSDGEGVADDIESMMENSEYSFFGIRVDDVETPLSAGDDAPKSRVWENGDPTDEMLDGTSTYGVDEYESGSVTKALEGMGVTSGRPKGVSYYGEVVYLLGADDEEQGEDMGESILKDAKVVATYIRSKKLNAPIEYRISSE